MAHRRPDPRVAGLLSAGLPPGPRGALLDLLGRRRPAHLGRRSTHPAFHRPARPMRLHLLVVLSGRPDTGPWLVGARVGEPLRCHRHPAMTHECLWPPFTGRTEPRRLFCGNSLWNDKESREEAVMSMSLWLAIHAAASTMRCRHSYFAKIGLFVMNQ